jgi:hypothetical protein
METLQEQTTMFIMFIHRSQGSGIPEAVIREVSEVVEVEGLRLVRNVSTGSLSQLYGFESVYSTKAEALRAGAERIEEFAASCLAAAISLRGEEVRLRTEVASQEPVSV